MRVRTIINPTAGRQYFQNNARQIVKKLLADHTISESVMIETKAKGDACLAASQITPDDTDLLFVAGGDGTVNEVINGLIQSGHDIPLAILPAGTANDFAFSMKLPKGVQNYCAMIRQFKTKPVDIGRIGSKYFLNVAAGGILTDVSYKVPSEAKTVLGQFAYLLSGALDLPSQLYNSLPIAIWSEQMKIEDEILLFIVTNTSSVGGFRNIAPLANSGDGKLDVVTIHRQSIVDAVPLFLQLVNGDHLNNSKISYFQTDRVEISCRGNLPVQLDLDGEPGPFLPVIIETIPNAVRILIP